MFLRYTFDSPIVRDEDHGFIRHYDVDVFGFGEEGTRRDEHVLIIEICREQIVRRFDPRVRLQ